MEDLKDKIEVMGYDILGLNDVMYLAVEAQGDCNPSCSGGCSDSCQNSCQHFCKNLILII